MTHRVILATLVAPAAATAANTAEGKNVTFNKDVAPEHQRPATEPGQKAIYPIIDAIGEFCIEVNSYTRLPDGVTRLPLVVPSVVTRTPGAR